jgi:hypothetical protein
MGQTLTGMSSAAIEKPGGMDDIMGDPGDRAGDRRN